MVRVAHFGTIGCRTPVCSISRPPPPAQTLEALPIAGRSCSKLLGPPLAVFSSEFKGNFSRDFVRAPLSDSALKRLNHGDQYLCLDLAAFKMSDAWFSHLYLFRLWR
jgi:hypothetical protein